MIKFIAEIGLNHLGSDEIAKDYCRKLSKTKSNAVTFQVREHDFYDGSDSWKNKLSKECYQDCFNIIKGSNKNFGFAIGDIDAARYCAEFKPDFWKVLSWGIKDLNLIEFLVKTNKPVYVSTGMSSMNEIVLVSDKFRDKVSFIHTQLSVDESDVNLSAIPNIKSQTSCKVSFGLHCNNLDVLGVAVAFSPDSLFVYIKDEPDFKYPDDSYAVIISDLDIVIGKTNRLYKSVGDGLKNNFLPKTLTESEQKKLSKIGRSSSNIKIG